MLYYRMSFANWSPYTTYSVNDVVYYNLYDWRCILIHTNQPPATGSIYWTLIGGGSGGAVFPTVNNILPVNPSPQYTLSIQTTALWNGTSSVFQYDNPSPIRLIRMACPTNDRRQILDSSPAGYSTSEWIAFIGGFFNGGAVASNQAFCYDNGGFWWCRYSNISGGSDNWLTIILIHNSLGTLCQAGSTNDPP